MNFINTRRLKGYLDMQSVNIIINALKLKLIFLTVIFLITTPLASQPSPDTAWSLQQCLDIAFANNPGVAAMESDAAAAQARQMQAAGERLPRLGAKGIYSRHLDEQRILPVRQPGEPAILSRDIFSGDIVLSLPLFTGGKLTSQVKAAHLLHQAATHQLTRSKEELLFNVSSVFFSILAQHHVLESLEFSLETLETHIRRIDDLIDAKKAAKVDRMRTQVRLADVRQELIRERGVLDIQRQVLVNLLGMESSIDEFSLKGELKLPNKAAIPELKMSLAIAYEKRDDYLAARSSLEAQMRNLDAAQARYWPTVSLQGSYGGRWAVGKTSGTGAEYGDVGYAGLALEIPLFEGRQITAKVREERAVLRAAKERLRQLELRIRLEVETALSNSRSAGEQIAAIQKSKELARESLRIEQQKYALGEGAIVDVLDAQSALLETETNYYRALAEYQTARAQFKLAIGEE